jgi:hypothetical protein
LLSAAAAIPMAFAVGRLVVPVRRHNQLRTVENNRYGHCAMQQL